MSYDQLDLAKLCTYAFSSFSQMVSVTRLHFLFISNIYIFVRFPSLAQIYDGPLWHTCGSLYSHVFTVVDALPQIFSW